MQNIIDENRLIRDFPKHNWLEKKYHMSEKFMSHQLVMEKAAKSAASQQPEDDQDVLIFHRLPVMPAPTIRDTYVKKPPAVRYTYVKKPTSAKTSDKSTQVTYTDLFTDEERVTRDRDLSDLLSVLNDKLISINDAILIINSKTEYKNGDHPIDLRKTDRTDPRLKPHRSNKYVQRAKPHNDTPYANLTSQREKTYMSTAPAPAQTSRITPPTPEYYMNPYNTHRPTNPYDVYYNNIHYNQVLQTSASRDKHKQLARFNYFNGHNSADTNPYRVIPQEYFSNQFPRYTAQAFPEPSHYY